MNTATMILAIAMGICIGYLACMKLEGVGGAPVIGRESRTDLESKNEVAENLIAELSIEKQQSYMVSLANWQLFSKRIYQSVKQAESKHKKRKCKNCGHRLPAPPNGKCSNTGLLVMNSADCCDSWRR